MVFAVGLVALVIALAGCNDDDASNASGSGQTPEEEVTTTEPNVVPEDSGSTEALPASEEPDPEGTGQSGGTEAGSGGASAYEAFRLPSGNIGCNGSEAGIRCDISDYAYEPPPRPKKCKLDWGHAVSVGGEFPGQVVCAGDTVLDQGAPVLDYGRTNTLGNITCTSSDAGVRCENGATGHGFFLSIQQVEVF